MKPLRHLPQQPLRSPTGARLVLCNADAGYPDHTHPSSPGRGRWFQNIESTDTKTFLRDVTYFPEDLSPATWEWPAVVLTPEEYKMRVGGMSVTELRCQLERYWGRGGIPGATVEGGYQDTWVPTRIARVIGRYRGRGGIPGAAAGGGYQDMWVPAWAPYHSRDPYDLAWYPSRRRTQPPPRLDPAIFSRWVNRECTQWLGYFIAKNHTFGVVHAWFTAFLGVTRHHRVTLATLFIDTAQIHDPSSAAFMTAISGKFRMSFDACIEGHDETTGGLPSLPLNTEITINKQGMQVIHESIENMVPRRIWDICANTVIPITWFTGPPYLYRSNDLGRVALGVKPVSHAWAANDDLHFIVTEANQQLWPIPLPKGVLLEDVRGEMIRLGVRYAWLDVLCLRQQAQPALAKELAIPVSPEIVERREQCRQEEWKVDVPTIGATYVNSDKFGLYCGGQIVIFMNGLGRPFRDEGWASERHWLNRAWTLQETPILSLCLIAGLPGGVDYQWDELDERRNQWPWNCKVSNVLSHVIASPAAMILYFVLSQE